MLRRSLAIMALFVCGTAAAQSMDQSPPQVVQSEKLDKYWSLLNSSVEADVPNYAKNVQHPGCATVSFVIEPDGSTSSPKVQRVVPDGDLSRVGLSIAKGLKFVPTPFNAARQRVFSWLIFPFNLPADKAAATAVMKQCYIEKLGWKDH